MKPIDSRLYNPRALCSRIRNAVGARVYLNELLGVVVPDLKKALKRLEAARLCTIEKRDRRTIVSFAVPYGRPKRPVPQYPFGPPAKKRQYLKPTAVVWVMGQSPKPCRSNRSPAPGIVSYVRVGPQVELIRFVGRVQGGWLVQPA
jgi:hypothetical protein